MKIPENSRSFICRGCRRTTKHIPIFNGQVRESKKQLQGNSHSFQTFELVQCRECGSHTYCLDTKIYPGHMMGDTYTECSEYFPPVPFRLKPEWYVELSEKYKEILNEIYSALDNSLFFLASCGTRTVIDQLIVEKIGDIGGFETKIVELINKGIIDEDEKEMFLAVINAGSASAHRNFRPTDDLLKSMMDIMEEILFKLLITPNRKRELKNKAKAIKKATPQRQKHNN